MNTQPLFFDLTTLLMAFAMALALIALFRKLKAIKNLAWFLLGLVVAYIFFLTGLGEVITSWLKELLYGSLAVSVVLAKSLDYCREREEWPEPEEFLLTFGIEPFTIFAILAGIALIVGMPIFFGSVGGGAADAIKAMGEAFGDALREFVARTSFLALIIMPALIAVLPIYILRHKNKLSFIVFGAIYGLLLTFILHQIGYLQVMVNTFTSLYGSWAGVPATVTSNVLSGFVLRMIDEWIASAKKGAGVIRRHAVKAR